jgi:hypothetical protein
MRGAFACELQERVLSQPFRRLRSDLNEEFASIHQTQEWWVDGMNAAGQFLTDATVSEHQSFLRITHEGRPVYRLFHDYVGVEIFGDGTDSRNFRDSTDIYVTVDVRMLGNAGMAWLGARTEASITGTSLTGYFLEMRRNGDGTTDFIVSYQGASQRIIYFEGPLPGADDETLPEWVQLVAITYRDQLAFFANGRFITSLDNAEDLGGSLAIGVETGTTADFDTLIIRDTTPRQSHNPGDATESTGAVHTSRPGSAFTPVPSCCLAIHLQFWRKSLLFLKVRLEFWHSHSAKHRAQDEPPFAAPGFSGLCRSLE